MAGNLTSQVRNIAQVATAVAKGDLSQKITVDARGEIATLAETINTMVDQLSSFADEVTRVAREVGTEGNLGGQAQVKGVSGTWRDLTENVNFMAGNLTSQVRNIAQVTTAVAQGDLSQKITVDAKGEVAALAQTINTMVDQLSSFADEVTRVAREVGTEGRLGGQAQVKGVSGTWRDLTDNVNCMAANLTGQVRNIAQVATAVANGDLSQKITVDAQGEILELKNTVNTMVDQLSSFADEVTRVAREVGTEGRLGGQAQVKGVSGTWRDLTDNVNYMASNLTGQVRNIALVTTAVAQGDLSQKITVDAQGEILDLKSTVNTMVDQLSAFAAEVTRVAREVGTEGKLGGQAEVAGVSGTWRHLTENVNQLAGNLTTQVRAIAEVSTAVTRGDLTRIDHRRGAGRGRRAQGQHQPDDREPAVDHRDQRPAGLAEDQPGPHRRPAAGPARPRRRHPDDHERGDAGRRGRAGRLLPRRQPRGPARAAPRGAATAPTSPTTSASSTPARAWSARPPSRSGRSASREVPGRLPAGALRPRRRAPRPTCSSCRCCSRSRCSASSSWRRSAASTRCTPASSSSSSRPSASSSTRSSPTSAPRSCWRSRSASRRSCRCSRSSCSAPTPSSRTRRACSPSSRATSRSRTARSRWPASASRRRPSSWRCPRSTSRSSWPT